MRNSSTWLRLLTAVLLLWQCAALASEGIKLSIAHWGFDDLMAQNLDVNVNLTARGLAVNASADSVLFEQPIGLLKKVSLQCDELVFHSNQTVCTRGKLTFFHEKLGRQHLSFSLTTTGNAHYQVSIASVKVADATITIMANYDNDHWHVAIASPQASLPALVKLVSPYLAEEKSAMLTGWTFDSTLAIKANISGYKNTLKTLELELQTTTLDISDSQGKYVTEGVSANVTLALQQEKKGWQWQTNLQLNAGQAYAEPVFVDFNDAALSVIATGEWQNTANHLIISHAMINHTNIAKINASYSGSLQQIQQLDISMEQADMAKLYSVWLQPFSLGTAVDQLEVAGQLGLTFKQRADKYQLSVKLDNVFMDDEKKHFGIYDLNGNIDWTNNTVKTTSTLAWQGGYIYAIPFGESRLRTAVQSSSITLLAPWDLPILDGHLQVNKFSLQRPTDDKMQWTFEGLLSPISMESLSTALGWPLMRGKISGVIPKVSYVNQQVNVDGALMVKLFEGTTIIRDLRLNKPFGALPQLYANVDLMGLDLEVLTQTFDFGKITGKLDGHVTGLRLSNWQPVQFDARFSTPEGDKSRRRISQKAIDNLSQIGGGIGGVLSRSFLRFFEDFSYQKLGLSCKLRNEVCEMSGVGEAKQGYYIVKGGGWPPRIDVVGYTLRVDWPELIERLKVVSQSSGPVIK